MLTPEQYGCAGPNHQALTYTPAVTTSRPDAKSLSVGSDHPYKTGRTVYLELLGLKVLPITQTLHVSHICRSVRVVLGVNVSIYGIHGVSGLWITG